MAYIIFKMAIVSDPFQPQPLIFYNQVRKFL